MVRKFNLAQVGIAVLFLATGLYGDKFQYSGSLTQTYVQTTGNQPNWLTDFPNTDEGSWKFTEALLGFSYEFKPNLRVGAQAVSRVFGNYGNYDLGLDWGYLDYRHSNQFGIRLGKVRYPLGLHNETRDVDAGRTSILIGQDLYPEEFRSFINAATGGMIYGDYQFDKYGDLEYQLTLGKTEIPDDFRTNTWISNPFINGGESKMKGDSIGGVSLKYHAPFDSKFEGLALGLSHTRFKGSSDIHYLFGPGHFGFNLDLNTTFYSFEYNQLSWSIGGEYVMQQMHATIDPEGRAHYARIPRIESGSFSFHPLDSWDIYLLPNLSRDLRAYSVYGEYQFTDKYTLKLMTSHSGDKSGSQISYRNNRYIISNRYDFNDYLIGKLEYTQVYDHNGKWGVFLARLGVSF